MDESARAKQDEEAGGRLRNPGGTRGGMGEFLIGLAMAIAGGYLFMDNVIVSSWGFGWGNAYGYGFGVVLIPFFIGIAMLFFDGRSKLGWLLTVGSMIAIVVGVISRL